MSSFDRELKWHRRFIELAHDVAKWSKDPSTKVGCVIIGERSEIRSTGYNGLPRGVRDSADRMERPAKYLWTSHAEENAVAQAALIGVSLSGCTAYVTHQPCSRCARTLIQAGISVVIFDEAGATNMPSEEFAIARQMFVEAGVECISVNL